MFKIHVVVKSLDGDLLSISERLVMFGEIWGIVGTNSLRNIRYEIDSGTDARRPRRVKQESGNY